MSGWVGFTLIELAIQVVSLSSLAHDPIPSDGATFVDPDAVLSWSADANATSFDVYFGMDKAAVERGTGDALRGRQDKPAFDPGPLAPLATYYWRVDTILADGQTRPGPVWAFTTVDFVPIDDFESYTDKAGDRIFQTWVDGWGINPPPTGCPGNGTGATVGYIEPPFAEQSIVHGGRQSMPIDYNNIFPPYYSEAERCYYWDGLQDWTVRGMNTLSLWFRGRAENSREPLYVGLVDSSRRTVVVRHGDPNALLTTEWQQWNIRLTAFAPVDIAVIEHFFIGVGDRQRPQPGGAGIVYVDDVRLVCCAALPEPDLVIDDFESYTDESPNRIFQTWMDGWGDEPRPGVLWGGSGACVGYVDPPFAEQRIVHTGRQSMPFEYNNVYQPYFSFTYRRYDPPGGPQDWSDYRTDVLSLWFSGETGNNPAPLFIAMEDYKGHFWMVKHTDPNVVTIPQWQQWQVPLATFTQNKVDISAVYRLSIGLGDWPNPKPGGAGMIYIDDIQLVKPVAPEELEYVTVEVIDDFESYTDDPLGRLYLTWIDGLGCIAYYFGDDNCMGGAAVGYLEPPYMEKTLVHSGGQSMPMSYDNSTAALCAFGPYTSETRRTWNTRQDWTAKGADTLTVWLCGKATNDPQPFYVVLRDIGNRSKAITHPDPNVLLVPEWRPWHLPLASFTAAGVDTAALKKMYIGVGGRENTTPGGTGTIYIDDIALTRRTGVVDGK